MEHSQQVIDINGLQIPLPFMTQYGLRPGSEVTVELHDDAIRIVPKFPDRAAIEKSALKLLLKSLGDALLVKANQLDSDQADGKSGEWRVSVYAHDIDEPLGFLEYARHGELLSDLESTLGDIRHKATMISQSV